MDAEIEKTPLWWEYLRIQTDNDKTGNIYSEVIFHLGKTGGLYYPMYLQSKELTQDYSSGFADVLMIKCAIPYGKYFKKILGNRDDLEVTINDYKLKENSTEVDWEARIASERYTAILQEQPGHPEFNEEEASDDYAMDLKGMIQNVTFQLLNKGDEQLRKVEVGGITHKQTTGDALNYYITRETALIKVDNRRVIAGTQIHPISNRSIYRDLVIPHGTPLVDLAGWLQQDKGVYSTGIGSYVGRSTWYLFPLFNTEIYQQRKRTMTIFLMPMKKFKETERTFRVFGDATYVLSAVGKDFQGDTNLSTMESGSGARFTNADNIINDFGVRKGGKYTVQRSKNNWEFTHSKLNATEYAPVKDRRMSANPFVEFSDLAKKKGGVLKLYWENSNPALLEPGMAIKVVYLREGVLKEAYGCLIYAETMQVKLGDVSMKKHSRTTLLYIFSNLKVKA